MFKRLIARLRGRPAAQPARPTRTPRAPLRSIADVEALMAELGLAPARDFILASVLPCTHYIATDDAGETAAQFGGLPRLGDVAWPVDGLGQPLGFLAELDLADRRLAFFYAVGAEQDRFEDARVLVAPGGAPAVTQPPPHTFELFERNGCFNHAPVRMESGVSLPSDTWFLEQVQRLVGGVGPDEPHPADSALDGLSEAATARPAGAIAQALGYPVDIGFDLRAQIAFGALKRPGREGLLQWTSWEAWEQAKTMSSRLRNGMIYRPWRDEADADMRWVLANRALIEAEIAAWRLLLSIDSNRAMDFWVNDADPVFFFIREDDLAARRFDRVLATATQG